MAKFVRWYDKDKYLSAFMVLLEGLSEDVQCEIAVDIMLNIPKIIEQDLNDYVNIMNDYNPQDYKRWYDYNPTLHSAVEAIKHLNKSQRETLITSISDIVLRNSPQEDVNLDR